MDLREVYKERIGDDGKNPREGGKCERCTTHAEGQNTEDGGGAAQNLRGATQNLRGAAPNLYVAT